MNLRRIIFCLVLSAVISICFVSCFGARVSILSKDIHVCGPNSACHHQILKQLHAKHLKKCPNLLLKEKDSLQELPDGVVSQR